MITDKKKFEEVSRLNGLIPEQLLVDSEALVTLLKEYYKFMDTDLTGPSHLIANAVLQKDIDQAIDSYVSLIQKEIGYKAPAGLVAEKRLLTKNIRALYNAKGSIDSFRLLFRTLFNKDVEIFLPKDQILIASDGRWSQQTSLFIEFTPADPLDSQLTEAEQAEVFELAGKIIDLTTSARTVSVEVERVRRTPVTDVFEIFISKNYTGDLAVGATLSEGTLSGTIVEGLNSFEISSTGADFKVGQIVDITNLWDGYDGYDDNGTQFKIKVSSVDSNGGITGLDFLSFGLNYEIGAGTPNLTSYSVWLAPETGTLMTETGVGTTVVWKADPTGLDETEKDASWAQIDFSNTAINQFTGSYTTNKGFLSDGIFLQDNLFYQSYSYVIRSDIPLDQYENVVKQTVHPAGMRLFGELQINNVFDLSAAIQALVRYFTNRVDDIVDTTDYKIYELSKPLGDREGDNEDYVYATTTNVYELTKPEAEEVFTATTNIYELTKPLDETVNTATTNIYELTKPLEDTVNTSEQLISEFYKVLFENITVSESAAKTLTKPFSEEVVVTEDSAIAVGGKPLESPVATSDDDNINLNKAVADSINTSDSGIIQFNPYSIGYFAEDYISGSTTF